MVPPTELADCSVISHLRSAQLPIGSPAIVEEPHAPLNADAGVVDDPFGDVLPAGPLVSVGDVGLSSFAVFSNAQPVMRAAASRTAIEEVFFIGVSYSSVMAHIFGAPWRSICFETLGKQEEHSQYCTSLAKFNHCTHFELESEQ
jgi:hypothetical protein